MPEPSLFSEEQLAETLQQLGATPSSRLFGELQAAYGKPQRFYHNQRHIAECLQLALEFDAAPELPAAIWFHDVIYDPKRNDNEEQSATLATKRLTELNVPAETIQRISNMILATKTHASDAPETQLLLDIDLAVLGASPDRFADYNQSICREYSWVPDQKYQEARRQVLQAFIDRPAIYLTPQLHARLEAPARYNIGAALTTEATAI